MPRLVLFELAMLIIPFALFGLYRLAVHDAEIEGRKAWPLTALFAAGIVLAILAWLVLLAREDRDPNLCDGKAQFDPTTGEIVQGTDYECDLKPAQIGAPQSEASDGSSPPTDDQP